MTPLSVPKTLPTDNIEEQSGLPEFEVAGGLEGEKRLPQFRCRKFQKCDLARDPDAGVWRVDLKL